MEENPVRHFTKTEKVTKCSHAHLCRTYRYVSSLLFGAISKFMKFGPAVLKTQSFASICVCTLKQNYFHEANVSNYIKRTLILSNVNIPK